MLSAVVLTKNEEANIVDCLDSLVFCDEIIVVDDYSEDKTYEIVESYSKKAKVKSYKHPLGNDFSAQRNFALNKTNNDWVLFVDADERVPKPLADEIQDTIRDEKEYVGFLIKRKDYMWGHEFKYGEVGNIKLMRLVNKRHGKFEKPVHEVWTTSGKTTTLDHAFTHYPHKTISGFLQEINFYTTIRANELYEKGVKAGFLSILLFPIAKFSMNYFIKFGFMDGIPGLLVSILMSFHSFLVRGKLWLIWQKKLQK